MRDAAADVDVLRREVDDLRAELRRAARISEVARRIAGEVDAQRLAQIVIDAATELTGAEFGALFHSLGEGRLESHMLYATSGVARERFARLALPRSTALLAPAFHGQAPVRIADVTADPRYGKNYPHRGIPEGHPPVRSYLAVPLVSHTGAPLGVLLLGHTAAGVFTDEAERTASELATCAAAAVDHAQLHGELQRVVAQLDRANAEVDQFAYAASHDLRALLRGIANLATWIDEDLPASTDAAIKHQLAMLRRRAELMDRLISGMLELARIGRTRQKVERIDVTALLHETIEMIRPREASRIMMIGEMPTLTAERAALQQVFLHLISNALQHAGRDDVIVRISAVDRGDEWELAIEDNGLGIAPEHHARVWQLFQTVQAPEVSEPPSIGLAIVRKQVERTGGRAWIDPDTTVGATIRFTWPKRVR